MGPPVPRAILALKEIKMERKAVCFLILWFICLVMCIMLLGCSHTPNSENIADGAKESISQAYQSLPKECQTEQSKKLLDKAQKEIDSVVASCELEKREIELKAQTRLLRTWLIGLIIAIIALVGYRIRTWRL